MSKHTPGPWEYRPAMNYNGYAIFPLGTLPSLASCERYGENMTVNCFNFPGSTEANARLIAAAPELEDALGTMANAARQLSVLHNDSESDEVDYAHETYKKAEQMFHNVINKIKG